MEAKDKAKELVDNFYYKVQNIDGICRVNKFEAKQCALIAVDEILETYNYYSGYWNEVKQEINKL